MVNYYTSQSIANYNDDAPPDDGTQSEANRTKYATVKVELADPIKTLAEAINSEMGNFEGRMPFNGSSAQSTNYTVVATDLNKLILASNTITITLLAAATATAGFVVTVKNAGTGVVTVDGNGSETIDGAASTDLAPEHSITVRCDGSNWDCVAIKRPAVLRAEQATTSGTAINETAIPGGATRVDILLDGVSIDAATSQTWELRIGPSAGPESASYDSAAAFVSTAGTADASNATDGFALAISSDAAETYRGCVSISLQDATNNVWTITGTLKNSDHTVWSTSGTKAIAGALDQLQLTTASGTPNFDAGAMSIKIWF